MSTTFYDNSANAGVGDDVLCVGPGIFNTQGQSFSTPPGKWNFNVLKVKIRNTNGAGNCQFTANLWADNGAAIPVTLIQNLATAFVFAAPDGNEHLVTIPITPAILQGSTRYWIFADDLNNTGTSWRTMGVIADGEFNAGMNNNAYPPTSDAVNGPTIMLAAGDPVLNLPNSIITVFRLLFLQKACRQKGVCGVTQKVWFRAQS